MRRREVRDERVEPPARLRAFDVAEWLAEVDQAGYDPARFRSWSHENWRRNEALSAWGRARLAWQSEHGWPGGLDALDLLREQVDVRRAMP